MPDLPPPEFPAPWPTRLRALAADAGVRSHHVVIGGAVTAVVVAVAVVVLGVGRSAARPEVSLPRAAHTATSTPANTGPASAADGTGGGNGNGTGGSADAAGDVMVDAAGAVARPGLYRVQPGARVADLITAAGGPAADADLDQLNLATRLSDGDRVYVPHRGELPPPAAGGSSGGVANAGPLNLNTATVEQLDALPGIGPTTAQAIVDYRRAHGRFRAVQDLLEVHGIGPAKLEQLRPKVRV